MTVVDQLVDVGEAKLYCEVQGAGPALVLVPGASGDGGYMQPLADALANEFTVVSYDRRGNSRSPRPEGWTETSIEEQARDLAGLIRALDLGPTVVLGNSAGAVVALCAIMEHEHVFRGALLHDTFLMSVLEHPEVPQGIMRPIMEEAMARGGPRAAMEAFVALAFRGSERALPEAVLDRMVGNGEVFFGLELAHFAAWRPDEERLRAVSIPVFPLGSKESAPFFGEITSWIAARVGNEAVQIPSSHVGFIDNAHEFAAVMRPLIRSMS